MNKEAAALFRSKAASSPWLAALLLGLGGLLLNKMELSLGWGLHFMFGNALVFVALRLLAPAPLTLAIAISSLQSIWLWHHAWAWGIWTIEAVIIARFVRHSSPIRNDVVFWLFLGAPLLWLTYGVMMTMDQLSLELVIVKQAVNGVLNVTLGELGYFAMLALGRRWKRGTNRQMPVEAFVPMVLMSVILIPTIIYLRVDAPMREQAVRELVETELKGHLRLADRALLLWRDSRAVTLSAYAREILTDARPGAGDAKLPEALRADFVQVVVFDLHGHVLRKAGTVSDRPPFNRDVLFGLRGIRNPMLADIHQVANPNIPHLELAVPVSMPDQRVLVAARLAPDLLRSTLGPLMGDGEGGLFLVNDRGDEMFGGASTSGVRDSIAALDPATRLSLRISPGLIGRSGFGNSLMNNMRDALLVGNVPATAFNGWSLIAAGRPEAAILKSRLQQLQLFLVLSCFIMFVTLLGSLIATRLKLSLRQLAQSAADLAMLGTRREKIDSLVIGELSDISVSIATAGSQVAHERGALVDYQRRLRSIVLHAPIVVYALNIRNGEKRGVAYVSDAIEPMLGYTAAEVSVDNWWLDSLHPDDRETCLLTNDDFRPGRTTSIEYRLRHKRGHYVWVYDNMSVEAGPLPGQDEAVGVLMDISDRKRAAEQLLQADKMASLGRMVSGITHEINQPLNFIKMAALNLRERLNHGRSDPVSIKEKLEAILSHVDRASSIILHMRVFGRTPSEKARPVVIAEAIDSVLTMIGTQLEVDDVVVDISACDRMVCVTAMPILLEQVLLNLVLNARDAIDNRRASGGVGPGMIRVTVKREDDLAIVSVEDDGAGIPADVLPLLFEPFFTTKPPRQGTGLGLSISYGIISDLDGDIRAENTAGGARFVIRLPIVEPAQVS